MIDLKIKPKEIVRYDIGYFQRNEYVCISSLLEFAIWFQTGLIIPQGIRIRHISGKFGFNSVNDHRIKPLPKPNITDIPNPFVK